MKKIFSVIIVCMICFVKTVNAQTVVDSFSVSIEEAIETAYEDLDLSDLQTGFFMSKSSWLFDPVTHTGRSVDDSLSNASKWIAAYQGLKFSCTDCPVQLSELRTDSVITHYGNSQHPIGIINVMYDQFKDDAFDNGLLMYDEENSKIQDVLPRSESPYEVKRLFIANAFTETFTSNEVHFIIPSSLYFNNNSESLDNLYIDFGDGNGYKFVATDSDIEINYSGIGVKTISVKQIIGGTDYISEFEIAIAPLLLSTARPRDLQWQVSASKRIGSGTVYANVSVWLGCDGILDKPVIVVEGFDALNNIHPDDIMEDYSFSDVLNYLEPLGYDIVIMDFRESTDYIQNNAALLREVLNKVNTDKVGNYENIVLGASMGGLIARYELRKMEMDNVAHETGLYISYDTPHKGAYIPLGFQYLMIDPNFVGILRMIPPFPGTSIMELQRRQQSFVSPAAKQMLIRHPLGAGEFGSFFSEINGMGYPLKCRNVALSDGSRNATLQIGTSPSSLQANDKILDLESTYRVVSKKFLGITFIDQTYKLNLDVWALPNTSQGQRDILDVFISFKPCKKCSYIALFEMNVSSTSDVSYETAPGGYETTQQDIAISMNQSGATNGRNRHCFVPSTSAVALNSTDLFYNISATDIVQSNLTPFDEVYGRETSTISPNSRHVHISNLWYVTCNKDGAFYSLFENYELQSENLYLQNKVYTYNTDHEATSKIVAGKDVTAAVYPKKHIDVGYVQVSNSSKVKYKAGDYILLQPGFSVSSGSVFTGFIDAGDIPCTAPRIAAQPTPENVDNNIPVQNPVAKQTLTELNSETIMVYPNPNNGETALHLELKNKTGNIQYVIVYNSVGGTVEQQNVNGNSWVLDVNGYPDGIYYLNIVLSDGTVENKKIFILR